MQIAKIITVILLLSLLSCEQSNKTPTSTNVKRESENFIKGKRQLEMMGYTDIKETPYPIFCCSKDDSIFFSTGFSARDKSGETVKGCICGGFLKGVTIRF